MSDKPDVCNDYKLIADLVMSFVNETYVEFRRISQVTYDVIQNSSLPTNLKKPKRSLLPFMGNILIPIMVLLLRVIYKCLFNILKLLVISKINMIL